MSKQSVSQSTAGREARAMLARRNVEGMQARGVICAVCGEGYGLFVGLRTGAHICPACNRSLSQPPTRRLVAAYRGPVRLLQVPVK